MPNPFQSLQDQSTLHLTEPSSLDEAFHRWSQPEIDALTLAQAAQRPLLVRGEPGTGKTQLARAAAQHLGWALLSQTMHPRYEAQDLRYSFDAVRRLSDAQAGLLKADHDESPYWEPGPLWRAYGWGSAQRFGRFRDALRPSGHVILIDEIDKAESDLPNSLLEVLGQRSFKVPPLDEAIGGSALADADRPLVIITTNEEREMPAAFLRRCVVLSLAAPEGDRAYREWLVQRGLAHFGAHQGRPELLDADGVIGPAADQLMADRAAAEGAGLKPPGAAEFLDLLYALHRLAPHDPAEQQQWIAKLSAYAFIKHGQVDERPELSQARPALGASAP